jgi:hypothetical protein
MRHPNSEEHAMVIDKARFHSQLYPAVSPSMLDGNFVWSQ